MLCQRHAPFFFHSIQQDKGRQQQNRINLKLPGRKSYFKSHDPKAFDKAIGVPVSVAIACVLRSFILLQNKTIQN